MAIPSSIKHIIVLMLENRSFDHMLGHLPHVEGWNGKKYGNHIDPNDTKSEFIDLIKTTGNNREDGYITDPDPPHDFKNVCVQLYGSEDADMEKDPKNNGFYLSYKNACKDDIKAKDALKCFTAEQLPVLTALARNFVVCDHWFSSVPGPTWPNRFFVHAATAGGAVRNQKLRLYDMKTIYNAIEEKNKTLGLSKRITWRIYFNDISHTQLLTKLYAYRETNFSHFNEFISDIEYCTDSDSMFPNYTFIEPDYTDIGFTEGNDQHPPSDVRKGEKLIAKIYKAIRSKKALWESCLFIILYDEHGGFYDHVPPPSADPPDDKVSEDPHFRFNRLGVRVPAILISPYAAKGAVDSTVYDHTSILATLEKRFDIPPLTKRDENAESLGKCFLTIPRDESDCPEAL